jgi:hypothetical protein
MLLWYQVRHFWWIQSEAKETAQILVKYGNTRDKDIGGTPIGHPMGPIIKKLRTKGGGASELDENCEFGAMHTTSALTVDWQTDSGAFMGILRWRKSIGGRSICLWRNRGRCDIFCYDL